MARRLDCQGVQERMLDFLYGELPEAQLGAFEMHVTGCARCRAELEAFEATRKLVREAPVPEPPSRVRASVMEAARAAVAGRAGVAPADARAVTTASDRADGDAGDGIMRRLQDAIRRLKGWQLPTLAAAGAVAVLIIGSKVLLDPEKTMVAGEDFLAEHAPPPASPVRAAAEPNLADLAPGDQPAAEAVSPAEAAANLALDEELPAGERGRMAAGAPSRSRSSSGSGYGLGAVSRVSGKLGGVVGGSGGGLAGSSGIGTAGAGRGYEAGVGAAGAAVGSKVKKAKGMIQMEGFEIGDEASERAGAGSFADQRAPQAQSLDGVAKVAQAAVPEKESQGAGPEPDRQRTDAVDGLSRKEDRAAEDRDESVARPAAGKQASEARGEQSGGERGEERGVEGNGVRGDADMRSNAQPFPGGANDEGGRGLADARGPTPATTESAAPRTPAPPPPVAAPEPVAAPPSMMAPAPASAPVGSFRDDLAPKDAAKRAPATGGVPASEESGAPAKARERSVSRSSRPTARSRSSRSKAKVQTKPRAQASDGDDAAAPAQKKVAADKKNEASGDDGLARAIKDADRAFAAGQWAKARDLYRALLRKHPDHADIRRWRARLDEATEKAAVSN